MTEKDFGLLLADEVPGQLAIAAPVTSFAYSRQSAAQVAPSIRATL